MLLFEKADIKPGKPATFGISGDAVCFGLVGNPVSTFVLFEILVKPFLYKMMGHDFFPHKFPLPLGKTLSRERAGKESIIPVVITGDGNLFLLNITVPLI